METSSRKCRELYSVVVYSFPFLNVLPPKNDHNRLQMVMQECAGLDC